MSEQMARGDGVAFSFKLRPMTIEAYAAGQTIIFEPYRKEQRRIGLNSIFRFLAVLIVGGLAGLATSFLGVNAELEIESTYFRQGWAIAGFGVTIIAGTLLLVGVGLGLLCVRAGGRNMMLWFMKSSNALNDPGCISFSATGLTAIAPSGKREFPWRTITSYRRANGFWFIIVDSITFYWLADDMVSDPVAFATYLDHHIAAASTAPSTSPPPQT